MKKTYQAPYTISIMLRGKATIMAGSITSTGLQNFEGYGGKKSGGSADSRSTDYWDDED